jgi:signal transduction histidine kinase
MAALTLVFVAGLLMAAWYLNRWISHTLRLQSENARLIRQLTGVLADLEQRTADLTTACDEANWANQAKTRFVAAASHDLGQPFQAMRLFLDLLERRLADPADRELLHHLNDAHHAGERMLGSLLDLSRLQTGTVEPRIEAFPMADLLDRLETDFRSLAASQGLTLRVRRCNAVVRSDPVLLQRIIANLLANAVRYTRHGGILLGCRRRDQTLRIEVWDTGVGIPADHQDEIFEEFRQLDGAPEAGAPGVGLGLAIVRETAHLLHHPIQICSVPNRGSVFSVAVPLGD